MKRRSINYRSILLGLLLLVFALAFFTKILNPLHSFFIDTVSTVLIGYKVFPFNTDNSVSIEEVGDSASILSKRSDEFQNTLLLNKSIKKGTPITFENILVGFVETEGSRSSTATLISSPFFTISGILERSGIPVELTGRGASLFEIRLPRGTDILLNDKIYYNNDTALFIGSVVDIIDTPSDPLLKIVIRHGINSVTLTRVTFIP